MMSAHSRKRETWQSRIYNALPKCAGVYMIGFKGSQKVYVGCSKNISKRVRQRLSEIPVYWHKLNDDFKTLGPENFTVSVLATTDNLADLPALESYWMGWASKHSMLVNAETWGKSHHSYTGVK